ncbi:MAG: hypothetical protein HETSPECPRED_004539 [Heterodermia speciosa]|uniref:Isopenicillin N synthase-like Fe(2+) 2OG dioxygenase domain-containing protein n=1 Tax=Heterodermia speciosa TaxID=116794 RepID=A0A8H3IPQ0_9LECA|nr:MAG: hypothetical protein HETSPECPRED_004539 [Heterodermia speciosa]
MEAYLFLNFKILLAPKNHAIHRNNVKDCSSLENLKLQSDTMEEVEDTDAQALSFLASEGFLPLILAGHKGMPEAYSNLFHSSRQFFDLPEDSFHKTTFQAASGSAASEEGYSDLPGEKSILTVKSISRCPELLKQQVETAWNMTGALLLDITRQIASTLGLQLNVFDPFVEPCSVLPREKRTPTLLRMFRYIRPQEGEATINAERHKDIGLLSLVIGHSPGLEVLDTATGLWKAIESEEFVPEGAKIRSGGLTATLLVGETMSLLTRGRYKAGVHRVLCAPDREHAYRFSIVYTLRPAVAPLYTKDFESEIVGHFAPEEEMDGQSSKELFERIRSSHWNVNVVKDLREEQQKRLRAKAIATGTHDLDGYVERYAPPPGPPPGRDCSDIISTG